MGRNRRKGAIADALRKRQKRFSPRKQRKANRHAGPSGLELKVEAWLKELELPYKAQAEIPGEVICHVDFLVGQRTIVEVQGCYFHGCRTCFHRLSAWQTKRQRSDGWRFDFFMKAGYDVITIWEHEVEKEPERVRAMLRALKEIE